ncbi:hypothetical protein SAMN04487911_1391 [Arenibacter nanhaiticus]|uniref:Uncharacterized protein n=1 Tax=Arenibacter nanhaiticus TaxID=558155 RepID=A0A1M6M993_9FLAO|nr:hypothetical protein [Arenibacter nanhaiticus]SHJ80019.1 hypothetical protein SAMN04487911_1391 [Arenibacter nanhaiticus]
MIHNVKLCWLLCFLLSYSCEENNVSQSITVGENEIVGPGPFNSNRLFIKHGLQLLCWVGNENLDVERVDVAYYKINNNDWKLSRFKGATFFVGPTLFNKEFILNDFPETQWSMAKAPYGKHLTGGPIDYEFKNGFLQEEQLMALSRLTSLCIGDEEDYTPDLVKWTRDWFSVSRKHYPDVLLHNNQFGYGGQWNVEQLRGYVRTAKPDLLTYDAYYFLPIGEKIDYYRGAKAMAEDLMMYRNVALEGYDGTGTAPIAFGQYTQGYKQDGAYEISESELRLYYSLTWTFGGKWLNWFRWLQGNNDNGITTPTSWAMLLKDGIPGQPTKYMDWTAQANKESLAIGEHLVRLQTTNVSFKGGSEELTNGKPKNVNHWNPDNGQLLETLEATCNKRDFIGKSGDLYIGSFEIIPDHKNGDPNFFDSSEAEYFMITNALTTNHNEFSAELSQIVRFSIKKNLTTGKGIYIVNRVNGFENKIKGEPLGDRVYFEIEINGGDYAFFVLK